MKRLTKRQQKRIEYLIKEKQSRKEKQNMLHDGELPKFAEKHVPYIRRLSHNIDQLLIVASFVQPELKLGLIDRLLVIAELEDVQALICLNKTDLVEDAVCIEKIAGIYRNIGYNVVTTSAKMGDGIKQLLGELQNKTSALAGHSGVGKSSLLNAINPDLQVETGEISDWNNKGRHTTTTISTYTLAPKTQVIDLPGMKKVDFVDLHRDEARFYFREFVSLAEECKFSDCMHINETHCAVKLALEENRISPERYKSYLNFVDSL